MACERPTSADRYNHQIQSQLCYGGQSGNDKIMTTIMLSIQLNDLCLQTPPMNDWDDKYDKDASLGDIDTMFARFKKIYKTMNFVCLFIK